MVLRETIGIPEFDKAVGGVPTSGFSIFETPNHKAGMTVLGHYLMESLQMGDQCALITFESPVTFMDYFSKSVFDFYPYIESGQLAYLNFNASVSNEIGLTQKYDKVFDEILHLCGNDVRKIAINQIDALFSLHNHSLINSCAQKLVTEINRIPQTVVGQYMQFNDEVHRNLSIACQKTASAHFSIEHDMKSRSMDDYVIHINKVPWHEVGSSSVPISLNGGNGFGSRIQAAS